MLIESVNSQITYAAKYKKKLNKMMRDLEALGKQKNAFSKAKQALEDDIIEIDVGGTAKLSVARATMCQIPRSKLQAFFSCSKKTCFVDRDAKHFTMLVNYLRSDRSVMPSFSHDGERKLFEHEAEIWDVPVFKHSQITT